MSAPCQRNDDQMRVRAFRDSASKPFRRGLQSTALLFVAIALLVVVALAILVTVVLIPPYARLRGAEYELSCLKADFEDDRSLSLVYEKLIEALPEDEVLTIRVARRQNKYLPADEVVVINPSKNADEPQLIQIRPHKRIPPPDRRLVVLAECLEIPAKRRGLLVLAAAALIAGVLLAAPSRRVDEFKEN